MQTIFNSGSETENSMFLFAHKILGGPRLLFLFKNYIDKWRYYYKIIQMIRGLIIIYAVGLSFMLQ